MIDVWRPRYFMLVDIGGGFSGRDGLKVGDLVIASSLEYYSLVKEIDGRTETRPLPFAAPARGLRKDLGRLDMRAPDWDDQIPAPRPDAVGSRSPQILPGQIVVGERLLADPNSPTVAELANRYPKALAVDMESVGLARAVYGAQQQEVFTQFAVLRGISDIIDDPCVDNQRTRDNVKPYAAAVAMAAAHAYIRTHPSGESILSRGNNAPTRRDRKPYLGQYLHSLRRTLAASPSLASPLFRLPLQSTEARSKDSSAPFPSSPVERNELLDIVEHDRRVAVIGRSGVGKSELLNAAVRQLAAADDPVVVHIDLKTGWSSAWAEAMPTAWYGEHLDPSMDALLNAATPPLAITQLNEFAEDSDRLILLVDALNEVPPSVARQIRLVLGEYSRQHPNVQVLVTDRVGESEYRELRWTVLMLPSLDPAEAERILDARFSTGAYGRLSEADQGLLRIPFYLDRALREAALEPPSALGIIEQYWRGAGLSPRGVEVVGQVALDALMRGEAMLSQADRKRLEEQGLLDRLLESHLLVKTPSNIVFAHRLIHQYFAGKYLATDPSLWQPEALDAITSFAASPEGVGMVIKSIPDKEGRDKFLHRVYDWNWRASVQTLSESRAGVNAISEATEEAILAMAAEKRFDPVEGTRERITALLADVAGPIAAEFKSLEQEGLQQAIAAINHPESSWWQQWQQIFLAHSPAEIFSDGMIEQLVSETSLIGWMAANVLRRAEPPIDFAERVRLIYRSHPDRAPRQRTIRWRVLHTLGAWPAIENARLLIEGMGDEHIWCRYGAVRSLIEMAARTSDHGLRDQIIDQLSQRWTDLDPEPLSQLAWASRYADADAEWPLAIRPLIEQVRDAQRNEERERWERRFADFERYAERHTLRRG